MVSCPERAAVRAQTLAQLAATDWNEPVTLALDDGSGNDRLRRIVATWRKALGLASEASADLSLIMEDDLDFNRHLRENLRSWMPLARLEGKLPFFASLYNPGIHTVHSRPAHRYHLMDANGCWGAQALLVSRAMAEHLVRHWDEFDCEPDLRMPRLAARLAPIFYHLPSLVEHIGDVSTWGGCRHRAVDFDRDWRASNPRS